MALMKALLGLVATVVALGNPPLQQSNGASEKPQSHLLRNRAVRPFATAAKLSPTPWPSQFHAVIFQNRSSQLTVADLWYDWPNGGNLLVLHRQLSQTLWDLEWTNGTSFYIDKEAKTCKTISFDVGILPPDWLAGAELLGRETIDGGFECWVWTKADFVTYYEDIKTGLPVRWSFHSGPFQIDVITFEKGKTLPASEWQAPDYCFS
eukprot:TRINITY_DN33401_c0_g1_i1.p1 TRINITY_DN33401_c0_g1~~TRINITY_DN33401_c0_g1_i1.p1  ORF type:complete len:207 (+),score=24.01 TRINITY_DN33401_c0_g1_i1:414-1034(+)